MSSNGHDDQMNTRQAAFYIGVSPSWLKRHRKTGDGPPVRRFGRKRIYLVIDLDSWIAANTAA